MKIGDFYVLTIKNNTNEVVNYTLVHSFMDAEKLAFKELSDSINKKVWIEEINKVYLDIDNNEIFDSHIVKIYKNDQ